MLLVVPVCLVLSSILTVKTIISHHYVSQPFSVKTHFKVALLKLLAACFLLNTYDLAKVTGVLFKVM